MSDTISGTGHDPVEASAGRQSSQPPGVPQNSGSSRRNGWGWSRPGRPTRCLRRRSYDDEHYGGSRDDRDDCGGDPTTHHVPAPVPPLQPRALPQLPPSGREIKLGNPTPQTGYLASFGAYEKWSTQLSTKVLGDGMVLGDGQKHKITILQQDTQSDSNRAGQVTGDFITNTKVDMIVASGTPDTDNPAADQAEALGCPMLFTNNPIEAYIFGRGHTMDTVEKYVYGMVFGILQEVIIEPKAYAKVPTNKHVGLLFANDADGNAWAPTLDSGLKAQGFQVTLPDLYPTPSDDFTSQITIFKKNACDICISSSNPPDFVNFWKQAIQQGYKPKLVFCGGKAFGDFSFPNSLGDISIGFMACWLLHRTFPFTDSLTGLTVPQLCDKYEADTGMQWSENCGVQAKLSWAVDVLKRAKNLDDKESIVEAIKTTKMETVYGPIDMTEPVDKTVKTSRHITANLYLMADATSQCVRAADAKPNPVTKWKYEMNVVASDGVPNLPDYQTIEQYYG